MSTKEFVLGWVTRGPVLNVGGYTSGVSALIRILLIVFVIYLIGLGSYRLLFSPLAPVPGPKIAALTYWYETYYEVWKGGQYFKEVAKMHKKYGPIVRVSPREVHFEDPDFIETLYPSRGKKVDKPEDIAIRAGTPGSIVATVEHDKHRRRRNVLVSFFSGASVRRLEPIIKDHVEQLLQRLGESDSPKTGRIFEMHHVFKACMSDLITQYAFGESLHFLDQKDFGRSYYETSDKLHHLTHVVGNWPWLFKLGELVPRLSQYMTTSFFPTTGEFLEKQSWWINKVREIRGSKDPEVVANTIFGGILNSSLPEEDKSDGRLANEAQLVVLGGEGTTSQALTAALYHLLANPIEFERLKDEIHTALPGPAHIPRFSQVNGLPFLNAVINETIRLHPGVMNRHTRVFPEDPLVYVHKSKGVEYRLPAGTVVSMSPLISHMNATVFADPYEFRPQRWLDNPEIVRGFIGFSRGTRGCIGMALARHEMTMTLASLFLKYDIYRGQQGPTLELYDTIRERDVDANSDYILPQPAKGSRGLRVRVRA